MTDKIVPVPDGNNYYIRVEKRLGETKFETVSFEAVSKLQDAPTVAEDITVDMPVIEMPADDLAEFEAVKQSRTLLGILETVYDRGLQMAIPLISDAAKQKAIGEYYSNHVKFVAKENIKYMVEVTIRCSTKYVTLGEMSNDVEFVDDIGDAHTFLNDNADFIVLKLGGNSGLLQPRKVKAE